VEKKVLLTFHLSELLSLTENGKYINIVPKGFYGDVSGEKNMREVSGTDANSLTFFLYEEIAAFRPASLATGLTPADICDIFYNNAKKII
jgi:hypothetical protein